MVKINKKICFSFSFTCKSLTTACVSQNHGMCVLQGLNEILTSTNILICISWVRLELYGFKDKLMTHCTTISPSYHNDISVLINADCYLEKGRSRWRDLLLNLLVIRIGDIYNLDWGVPEVLFECVEVPLSEDRVTITSGDQQLKFSAWLVQGIILQQDD